MSAEIQASYQSGKTLYALIRNSVGQIWSTVAGSFGTYATGSYTDYDVSLTEQGTASAFYTGTFPAAIAAGVYGIVVKQQLGGSPAETDPTVAAGDFHWNGTAAMPLSDLATSGQVGQFLPMRLFRGQMIRNFSFKMVSTTDHVTGLVSGVVSGQILRDNGNWGALQSGAFTEKGRGWYTLQALTSGDLLADTAALEFTAVGVSGGEADPKGFSLILQRVSGYV